MLLGLLGVCTGGVEPSVPTPTSPVSGEPPPRGSVTAAEALAALCSFPGSAEVEGSAGSVAPFAVVDEVAAQVEQLRGLRFGRHVTVDLVPRSELVRGAP